MGKKKANRNSAGKQLGDHSSADKNTGDKNTGDNKPAQGKPAKEQTESKTFLEPDPPKPRPILWIASGILMIAWMIFLLFVATSG